MYGKNICQVSTKSASEDCSCTYYNYAELFSLCCISLSPKLDGLLKTFHPNLRSGGFFFDDSVTAQATYFQAPPLFQKDN